MKNEATGCGTGHITFQTTKVEQLERIGDLLALDLVLSGLRFEFEVEKARTNGEIDDEVHRVNREGLDDVIDTLGKLNQFALEKLAFLATAQGSN